MSRATTPSVVKSMFSSRNVGPNTCHSLPLEILLLVVVYSYVALVPLIQQSHLITSLSQPPAPTNATSRSTDKRATRRKAESIHDVDSLGVLLRIIIKDGDHTSGSALRVEVVIPHLHVDDHHNAGKQSPTANDVKDKNAAAAAVPPLAPATMMTSWVMAIIDLWSPNPFKDHSFCTIRTGSVETNHGKEDVMLVDVLASKLGTASNSTLLQAMERTTMPPPLKRLLLDLLDSVDTQGDKVTHVGDDESESLQSRVFTTPEVQDVCSRCLNQYAKSGRYSDYWHFTPLHEAAVRGDLLLLRALLKDLHANPNVRCSAQLELKPSSSADPEWLIDKNGPTAIHLAAKLRQPEVVAMLMQNGANVNAKAHLELFPDSHHLPMGLLMEDLPAPGEDTTESAAANAALKQAVRSAEKSRQGTPLHQAVCVGATQVALRLLGEYHAGSAGVAASAWEVDTLQRTPFHYVCGLLGQMDNAYSLFEAMITHVQNTTGNAVNDGTRSLKQFVNQPDMYGRSSLHYMVRNWKKKEDATNDNIWEFCLDALLAHGADPTLLDHNNETPLHFAAASGCKQLVQTLLQAASTQEQHHTISTVSDTNTPPHNQPAPLLVNIGCISQVTGYNALHLAIVNKHDELALQTLLPCMDMHLPAYPFYAGGEPVTVLDVARRSGAGSVAHYFERHSKHVMRPLKNLNAVADWQELVASAKMIHDVDVQNDFSHLHLLAQSNNGAVYRAIFRGEQVVVKREQSPSASPSGAVVMSAMKYEFNIIGRFNFKHILQCRYFVDPNNATPSPFGFGAQRAIRHHQQHHHHNHHHHQHSHIPPQSSSPSPLSQKDFLLILEHADQGDLLHYGHKATGGLNELQCRKIFKEMVSALYHMHCEQPQDKIILHCDIKPDNILLVSCNSWGEEEEAIIAGRGSRPAACGKHHDCAGGFNGEADDDDDDDEGLLKETSNGLTPPLCRSSVSSKGDGHVAPYSPPAPRGVPVVVKMADFGISRIVSKANPAAWNDKNRGTFPFLAPETWMSPTGCHGGYFCAASDVYQVATTMGHLLTGQAPYHHLDLWAGEPYLPEDAAKSGVSEKLWSLLQNCWSAMPGDRQSTDDLRRRTLYFITMPDEAKLNLKSITALRTGPNPKSFWQLSSVVQLANHKYPGYANESAQLRQTKADEFFKFIFHDVLRIDGADHDQTAVEFQLVEDDCFSDEFVFKKRLVSPDPAASQSTPTQLLPLPTQLATYDTVRVPKYGFNTEHQYNMCHQISRHFVERQSSSSCCGSPQPLLAPPISLSTMTPLSTLCGGGASTHRKEENPFLDEFMNIPCLLQRTLLDNINISQPLEHDDGRHTVQLSLKEWVSGEYLQHANAIDKQRMIVKAMLNGLGTLDRLHQECYTVHGALSSETFRVLVSTKPKGSKANDDEPSSSSSSSAPLLHTLVGDLGASICPLPFTLMRECEEEGEKKQHNATTQQLPSDDPTSSSSSTMSSILRTKKDHICTLKRLPQAHAPLPAATLKASPIDARSTHGRNMMTAGGPLARSTHLYDAPELRLANPTRVARYSPESDVWAWATALVEALLEYECQPYHYMAHSVSEGERTTDATNKTQKKKASGITPQNRRPDALSPPFLEADVFTALSSTAETPATAVIKRCWEKPSTRPTCTELLSTLEYWLQDAGRDCGSKPPHNKDRFSQRMDTSLLPQMWQDPNTKMKLYVVGKIANTMQTSGGGGDGEDVRTDYGDPWTTYGN